MPFSREDKHLIKLLRQENHYTARYFLKEFPNRNWTLGGLKKLVRKIDNFGSVECKDCCKRRQSCRSRAKSGWSATLSLTYSKRNIAWNRLTPLLCARYCEERFELKMPEKKSRIVHQHIELALPWFLERDRPEFIAPLLWPPHSPDLNPVDYSVWSILQGKVYKTRITDLDDLKHHITTEWAKLDHAVIAAAVRQWRRRLSACVRAGDGNFSHCF